MLYYYLQHHSGNNKEFLTSVMLTASWLASTGLFLALWENLIRSWKSWTIKGTRVETQQTATEYTEVYKALPTSWSVAGPPCIAAYFMHEPAPTEPWKLYCHLKSKHHTSTETGDIIIIIRLNFYFLSVPAVAVYCLYSQKQVHRFPGI